MDDTSVLETPTREVAFRGETLTIAPLKVGQIPGVLRHIRPILGAISGLGTSPAEAGGGVELDILVMVENHGENLIEAAAIAIKRPAAFVADADADEFAALVKLLIEVNADFFAKKVAPLLAGSPVDIGAGKIPSNT